MSISQNFPNSFPSLVLDFTNSKTLDPRITFTRASAATYVDEDGLIKTAVSDQSRFDHDPITGECKGLLIETSRSNLVKTSNNFSSWLPSNITITSSSSISPDGISNAPLLTATATGINYPYAGMFSVQANNTYTFSVWTKFEISFSILMYGTGFGVLLLFDSATKQPSTSTINSGTTGITGKVESYSNGWYRVSATSTSTGTNFGEATIALNKNKVTTWGLNNSSSIGDTLTVWGAQLEQGAFPTSYIPTSGSAITRAADNAEISSANFSPLYNELEGTLFAKSDIYHLGTENQASALLYNPTTVGFIGMGYRFGGVGSGFTGSWINNSGDQLYRTHSGITSDTSFKQALAYKTNDGASCVNGGTVLTDTTISVPTGTNRLYIGKSFSGYDIRRGRIQQIMYYPKRLTNTQLQSLTK